VDAGHRVGRSVEMKASVGKKLRVLAVLFPWHCHRRSTPDVALDVLMRYYGLF